MTATTARLAAFTTAVMWGLSFVATKAALQELAPATVIFSRFAMGTVVLVVIARLRGRSLRPALDAWPMLALMGFVGIFVHQLLQVYGLTLTTAVKAGWLIGMIPIWTALLSAFFLKERFGIQKVVGLALGTIGAIVVVTRGELTTALFALPTMRGDLLLLASTITWAVYTILGRGTLTRLDSASATAVSMGFGSAMLAPIYFARGGWHEYASLSPVGWGALLFLGIGCSGLGYFFWFAALERLETSQVAAFLYLEAPVTLAAAVTLLGEPVAASTIVGGGLVLAGVYAVQRG
jgi:drug/metabolite transporter (DMT)-like permease